MKLSVVTTLYCSERFIPEFYRRITASASHVCSDFELIFVNDGSPDDSLNVAVALAEKDPRVTVIGLSRNFGHHKALMTGLAHAKGDQVLLIDVDLEEPPESLETFWAELAKQPDVDVVYGVQASRKGGLVERLSGAIFYRLFNLISPTKVPANLITARLMRRRYVDGLLQFRESELFLGGIWALAGFEQRSVAIVKTSRGTTSYSLRKRISLLVSAITSFTSMPLNAIFYAGVGIIFVAFTIVVRIVYRKFVHGIPVAGWASLLASIWLIGGLSLFSIGLVGIYLSKVYMESKRRPSTIIRQIYRGPGPH
jgi:putative glycosyltransferase